MSLKPKARAYFTAVNRYDQQAVAAMIRDDYIQHNPKVPTGRAAFVNLLPKLAEHGSQITNIRMLEDGNHIIMHHQWSNATPFGADKTAAFHIIRFDDDETIAEHWNVMTPMETPNPSGRTLTDGPTIISTLEETDQNKEIVREAFSGLVMAPSKAAEIIPKHFEQNLHQHHPLWSDGADSLVAAIKEEVIAYNVLHALFGEGNFVLSITEGKRKGIATAFYDLFRIENRKICEHWSVYQEIPSKDLANDNTMFGFKPVS